MSDYGCSAVTAPLLLGIDPTDSNEQPEWKLQLTADQQWDITRGNKACICHINSPRAAKSWSHNTDSRLTCWSLSPFIFLLPSVVLKTLIFCVRVLQGISLIHYDGRRYTILPPVTYFCRQPQQISRCMRLCEPVRVSAVFKGKLCMLSSASAAPPTFTFSFFLTPWIFPEAKAPWRTPQMWSTRRRRLQRLDPGWTNWPVLSQIR